MSKDAKDGFDPRFDPAFQPGFSGQVVTPKARQKGGEAPAAGFPISPMPMPSAVATSTRPRNVDEMLADQGPDAAAASDAGGRRRPNPFLLALIAVSAALIVGGLGAAQSIRSLFDTENISVELDYMSLEMIKFAAPLAVGLGVATAIGVLFIYALDWKRRHDT